MSNRSRLHVVALASLVAGCAGSPIIRHPGPGAGSVTLSIHHDHAARPQLVRLARAEYAIDGTPVVSLLASGADWHRDDVADEASWTGAVRPGQHVLEARLHYPVRPIGGGPSDDLEFQVVRQYRFEAPRTGNVRIRVEEACDQGGAMLSMDKRLDVRFNVF